MGDDDKGDEGDDGRCEAMATAVVVDRLVVGEMAKQASVVTFVVAPAVKVRRVSTQSQHLNGNRRSARPGSLSL